MIISELRNNRQVKLIDDQQVSPSYADNVAEMMLELAQMKISGIFNVANSSTVTRYDFGILLSEVFGLNKLKKKKIKTYTLTSLLKKNKIRKIDFMNIDIEDSELKVLKTLNFNYFDIKVICIEVINQFNTKQSNINKDKIIKILKKNNYILRFKTFVNYIFIKNEKIKK